MNSFCYDIMSKLQVELKASTCVQEFQSGPRGGGRVAPPWRHLPSGTSDGTGVRRLRALPGQYGHPVPESQAEQSVLTIPTGHGKFRGPGPGPGPAGQAARGDCRVESASGPIVIDHSFGRSRLAIFGSHPSSTASIPYLCVPEPFG
jgi:hypothetical protein